jgi:mono/diheme cytochrome c family protein
VKTALKALGGLVLLLVLALGALQGWAAWKNSSILGRTIETHAVDFPVPFPLDEAEVAALAEELEAVGMDAEAIAAVDLDSVAMARALERGQHLVEARYGCADCHGENFGGGVMMDAAIMGTLLGPNLTLGEGSRTLDYTPADWDRIVRHGVLPSGGPAVMPSMDFLRMSDQELSDIIAYIRAQPPVNETVPGRTFGPLGRVLMATGQIGLSADIIDAHDRDHRTLPPPAEPTAEFGEHLAGVCTGCHTQSFAGGKIPGGDPAWVAAANLTPHEDGLASWTFEQFAAVMVAGVRPDGTQVRVPMTFVQPMGQNMTETELRALWEYLQTVEALPDPQ